MENMLMLPRDFVNSMKSLLGDEFEKFESSYDQERFAGLRYNPLKCSREAFDGAMDISLKPVPWATEGFYYDLNDRPGKHPYHEAGAYYIQEPSAMSAVAVLDPEPLDYVLDLCAAPGGKSTQIAGRLMGSGLLVSNEIIKNRAAILSQNLERMGVRNAVCLNESSDKLASSFPAFFDKILVDAPCSGEGMFKKEENATIEWSLAHVTECAERQAMILDNAADMLRAGGVMVYSTCTFNPLENEECISKFLIRHPEFKIEESPVAEFFAPGRAEWVSGCEAGLGIEKSMRLWPHMIDGEGHFVVKLRKEGDLPKRALVSSIPVSKADEKLLNEIAKFMKEELKINTDWVDSLISDSLPITFGDNIYLCHRSVGSLKGLKVERPGIHVAVKKKNRLEPAHSLALALRREDVAMCHTVDVAGGSKYIAGETLSCSPELKGWTVVSVGPFSLGWGKASGGVMKNHYPKGLRIY